MATAVVVSAAGFGMGSKAALFRDEGGDGDGLTPRLRTVLDRLLVGLLFVDDEPRVVHANAQLCTMFGLPGPESLVGMSFDETCTLASKMFADPEAFKRSSQAAARDRCPVTRQLLRLADGRIFERDYVPLRADGEFWGSLWQYRDVTDQVRLNERLVVSERMASMGQLSSSLAHQINNPLTSVIANLELVAGIVNERAGSDPDLAKVAGLAEDARRAAGEIAAMVRDLRTFGGPDELGGHSSVAAVVGSTVRLLHNEIRHRAHLVQEIADDAHVVGAPSQLGHVFLNLLMNAAQALPVGHRDEHEIRIVSRREGDRVCTEFHDSGAGIATDVLPRIFEPFFTTKGVGVGTGLGLAICHGIVTSLGGTIEVDSEVGRGSIFRVWLPAAGPQVGPPEHDGPAVALDQRPRLLVVDDENAVRSVIERLLEADHDVTTVKSGAEALRVIEAGERYDLVLCDLVMPDVDGMDLYESLRAVAPDQADRTAFMTGGALTPSARTFLEEHAERRIYKPFSVRQLCAFVSQRLRAHRNE